MAKFIALPGSGGETYFINPGAIRVIRQDGQKHTWVDFSESHSINLLGTPKEIISVVHNWMDD